MDWKLIKKSDYFTRTGEVLKIDLESNYLKYAILDAVKYVKINTSYDLDQIRNSNVPAIRDIVYIYLVEFSVLYFMERGGNDNQRNQIIRNGGDLGVVLEKKAAFCRELSCFVHIVLKYYGINTQVITGNLGDGTAHVWLISGGGKRIIDPAYKKGITTPSLYTGKEIKRQVLVERR